MSTGFASRGRTALALMVLVAVTTVVGAGTLFACPFMQAPSCCSKGKPERHCPADNPQNCMMAVSENKIATAKPNLALMEAPAAVSAPLPEAVALADSGEPDMPARNGREAYLLNRALLI